MMSVIRHFDGYMRRLARICGGGTSCFNEELYERLKIRLVLITLNFAVRPINADTAQGAVVV